MSNATLVINNGQAFCFDIWQYDNDWDEKGWKEAIDCLRGAVQTAYNYLSEDENFADDDLYQLGDAANMLAAIDVKKED